MKQHKKKLPRSTTEEKEKTEMVINIFINNKQLITVNTNGIKYDNICDCIKEATHLQPEDYYLISNGKRLNENDSNDNNETASVHCILRQVGGKGGFGSMLRAIGAQIEKTTNREACRDLSGRRLRDINEEKRVKAWLEKQGEREREAEERKKRKIEKLLAVPKHEFKDEEYEKARAKLTDKVNDAFEVGMKQTVDDGDKPSTSVSTTTAVKRKLTTNDKTKDNKKKKSALWIDDDLSGSDLDSDDSEVETDKKAAIKC
ncbi:replication stress response regulator SDE2 [Drosophila innubila]|uniref:replication stress response regulator SDE2 n=1 Tax=Drosophila innubila TaxID=198719 RepID=UPI00148DB7C8|nr:replication stress response regulator SDE2 [Drosophila innubila]